MSNTKHICIYTKKIKNERWQYMHFPRRIWHLLTIMKCLNTNDENFHYGCLRNFLQLKEFEHWIRHHRAKAVNSCRFVKPEFVSKEDEIVPNSAVRHTFLAHNGYAYQSRKLNKYKIYAKIQNKSNKNVITNFYLVAGNKHILKCCSQKSTFFFFRINFIDHVSSRIIRTNIKLSLSLVFAWKRCWFLKDKCKNLK